MVNMISREMIDWLGWLSFIIDGNYVSSNNMKLERSGEIALARLYTAHTPQPTDNSNDIDRFSQCMDIANA